MIFEYEHPKTGEIIEREYPIGQAAKSIKVDGVRCRRALSAPSVIGISDNVSGRPIDFLSYQLDPHTYGKFHRGKVVTDEHGEKRLHFNSRKQADELVRAWNASPESEKSGRKLRPYGQIDEWNDDVKRGTCVEPGDGIAGSPFAGANARKRPRRASRAK